ncbi:hypothetical protein ABT382_17905 [Streptomyces pharetrae]|uniref:hypothetical protein n=1 Tax=Streptomyces pharetrae TaxID=291370 RepID=UPI00335BFBF8
MRLRTRDPRGWTMLDFAPEYSAVGSGRSTEPFFPWSPDELGGALFEIKPESAAQLLVALKGQWFQAANIPNFAHREEVLFRAARELLARFGPEPACWTNRTAARGRPDADLLNAEAECECLTGYTTDCGVVVASESEIGTGGFGRFAGQRRQRRLPRPRDDRRGDGDLHGPCLPALERGVSSPRSTAPRRAGPRARWAGSESPFPGLP